MEYARTELGRDAGTLFLALREWAEAHYEEIIVAREAYDERLALEPKPITSG